ncbi:MAG: dTDP-4-dehydrorhamnose 3,5-epimerase family protein [Candidatus Methylomirabilota bacterium]
MIHAVQVKPLKVLPDDRGFLMEMLREDESIFERFGQVYITGCRRGAAKGWHYHKDQTDHFVCVAGTALVVLYDGRENSPTRGMVQEFTLTSPPTQDPAPLLLKIPPLVVHGFTAVDGEEARIRPGRVSLPVGQPRDPLSLAGRGRPRGLIRHAHRGHGGRGPAWRGAPAYPGPSRQGDRRRPRGPGRDAP